MHAAYHLVATVAQPRPGADGLWRRREFTHVIQGLLHEARVHGFQLILDIQPGRADVAGEVRHLGPFLEDPLVDVVLCMDGFGSRALKRNTYRTVMRQGRLPFAGFKIFSIRMRIPSSRPTSWLWNRPQWSWSTSSEGRMAAAGRPAGILLATRARHLMLTGETT